ncbi:uncharacterized protein EI90DRAFT_3133952 [Cantharellus anzutake]|uniref:uncharacterized protein n=1 Tax=Cantharellus anzutake TaxID=1750568 RepID=UPI0019031A7F|nr:uncharacterized protein EI90DRAFT_3133952 [Cantharellus anzutake]KAF8317303.1 hypothetical protein EI90DRAFT_3133952 [Cantharellus anzutake]
MKQYVEDILVPYFLEQKRRLTLPDDYHCIWKLDVWAVHTSREFREWIYSCFPWIILDYVPGGCTGLFQPCDLVVQWAFKLALEDQQEIVAVEASLPELCQRMVCILIKAFHEINKPHIVLKAFEKAKSGKFNLSHSSLTSSAVLDILRMLHVDNPTLFSEFSKPRSAPEAPQNHTQCANGVGSDEPPFPPNSNECSDIPYGAALTHTLTGEVREGLMLEPGTQSLLPQPTLANELDPNFPEDANDLDGHCSREEDEQDSGDDYDGNEAPDSNWDLEPARQGGRVKKVVDLAARNRWWEGW